MQPQGGMNELEELFRMKKVLIFGHSKLQTTQAILLFWPNLEV